MRLDQIRPMKTISDRLFLSLLIFAVAIRIAIVWIPGNSVRTPWSGGGDMDAYVLLARNLVTGNGYTYAHLPTAFRNPGYPLFLALMMKLFGAHFAVAARIAQSITGFATAYFCMKAARILFDSLAARMTFIAVLLFPTLIYFSGEFLTEGLTSFFFALFLWTFAEDLKKGSWKTAIAMGCAVGLGFLVRANMAVLGLMALAGAYQVRHTMRSRRELVLIPLFAGILITPWVLRNWVTFGQPLLSTEGGAACLVSLVNPEARLIDGWDRRFREKVGYLVPNELETNDPVRLGLGSELEMNRRCWRASRELWSEMNASSRARWVLVKWETYWLSTDQLFSPGMISRRNRALHVAAVVFYWGLLGLGCYGWLMLRNSGPKVALILLGYATLMTILHSPFVMNSRIRAPLIDPMIAILAGGGAAALLKGYRELNENGQSSDLEALRSKF
jgi:4-amino-4-deoxy-L-arabinose transferase-like glycosyltransferase